MSEFDRRTFVRRTQALIEASPPATREETRSLLVDPLLATLGWDVRTDGAVDAVVASTPFEYVLSVAGTPAAFVAVDPFPDPLEESRIDALESAMGRTGVDRALYTNGRTVLLLASGGGGRTERASLEWGSLADREAALEELSRSTLLARLEGHARALAARRLAIGRDELAGSIVDELAAVAGNDHEPLLEAATDRFLEDLIGSLAASPDAVSDETSSGIETNAERPSDAGGVDRSKIDSGDLEATRSSGVEGRTGGDEDAMPAAVDEPTADREGEFVVRFFNERGSVGAIGHSSAEQALVQAAEYLLERGLSGVELPWDVEGEVVLADGPLEGANQQLSNGWYLNTAGNREALAERVEGLASRAGLRAMLTGDWDDQ